jgi:hypothetical protein
VGASLGRRLRFSKLAAHGRDLLGVCDMMPASFAHAEHTTAMAKSKPTEGESKSTALIALPQESKQPARFRNLLARSNWFAASGQWSRRAKQRRPFFPHVLLIGSRGLGGTTLAHCLARELGVNLHFVETEEVERVARFGSDRLTPWRKAMSFCSAT